MKCDTCGCDHTHHSTQAERRLLECIEAMQLKIEELEKKLREQQVQLKDMTSKLMSERDATLRMHGIIHN